MHWLIGAIVAGFSRLFASRIGMWIAGAAVFMGVGLAANGVLVQPLLDEIDAVIQANADGAGSAVAWMRFLNFDKAITMVMSAYASRAAIAAGKVALVKR